jgi:hypothetical protein
LLLPELNLVWMHVENRAELLHTLVALDRRQRDLGLELGTVHLPPAGHDSLL